MREKKEPEVLSNIALLSLSLSLSLSLRNDITPRKILIKTRPLHTYI
jgi:hypothetical protein